jgi:hypothetical protein
MGQGVQCGLCFNAEQFDKRDIYYGERNGVNYEYNQSKKRRRTKLLEPLSELPVGLIQDIAQEQNGLDLVEEVKRRSTQQIALPGDVEEPV